MEKEREKTLDRVIQDIEKNFGKGAIMRLGEKKALMDVRVIPTGAINLDIALGIGGIPRGRITEIYGEASSGKTTLALSIIAEAQKQSGVAAFIDAEHALDPVYARKIGVDTDSLLVSQPDTGEQALEIAESLVRSGAVDVIVVDSVAALVPKAELDGDMGDLPVGLQARLMSQALRKLTGAVSKSNTALIFINQVRTKIGSFYGAQNVTTTGGIALKFYSSVRIELNPGPAIRSKTNEKIGSRIRVKIVKNKLAPPFREAEFDIIYGEGIVKEGCVLDTAVAMGIVTKSGAWLSYGDIRLGQGRDNAIQYLKDNPDLLEEIENKVKEQAGLAKSYVEDADEKS